MKFTLYGFSQQRALEFRRETEKNGKKTILKLDCTDLMLLRWFVDFFPRMTKKHIEGKEYAWVNYATVIEDLPLLDLTKQSIYLKFKKMADFKILEHKHIKDGGSYSYFGFGVNYEVLIDTECSIKNYQEDQYKNIEGVDKKLSRGVNKKLSNKDSSIISNKSINNYKKEIDKEKKNPLCQNTEGRNYKTDHTKNQNEKQVRHKYGEYQNVLLSDQEYEKLKNEFPNDYKERIERLSEYVASSGKKYKNFLATIRSWARKEKTSMKNINTEQSKKIRDGSEYAMYD